MILFALRILYVETWLECLVQQDGPLGGAENDKERMLESTPLPSNQLSQSFSKKSGLKKEVGFINWSMQASYWLACAFNEAISTVIFNVGTRNAKMYWY